MTFLWRVAGALTLNPAAYEDVEADASAMWQSALVVLLSSAAAGVGLLGVARHDPVAIVGIIVLAFAAWMMWSLITYEIGANILPTKDTSVTYGQLLRTIGLASAPGIFRVVGILPAYTTAAFVVTSVWMLAAMIVAVRQALDYRTTGRAIAVCVLGWVLAVSFALLIGILYAPSLSGAVLR